MRRLREIWDAPVTWRVFLENGLDECGCCLGEVLFWVVVAILYFAFRR